jgi:hypothetical protein
MALSDLTLDHAVICVESSQGSGIKSGVAIL